MSLKKDLLSLTNIMILNVLSILVAIVAVVFFFICPQPPLWLSVIVVAAILGVVVLAIAFLRTRSKLRR